MVSVLCDGKLIYFSFTILSLSFLLAISLGDRDAGVHIHDIISYGIRHGFSADQVKDVVNYLFIEGHFYTTIDEHHWQYAV